MRILILSQYYHPEPIFLPSKLAEEMAARGHKVTVVTGFPHYPTGKIYEGHRLAFYKREERHGVSILRTWLYPYHGMSTIGRALNYGSFMLSCLMAAWLTPRCDVIYVWPPPLTVGVSAWLLSLAKRAPFVYDVLDIWPDNLIWSGLLRSRPVIKILQWMERFVYNRAALLPTMTEGAKRNLLAKGVPESKILVHPHWVDERLFEKPEAGGEGIRKEFGLGDSFVVTFAGNIGPVQGLEAVVETAKRLEEMSGLRFLIVGDGNDRARIETMAKDAGLGNIIFAGRQPVERMNEFFAASNALLVHLRDSPITEVAVPSKTMAYLASGRPILMAMRGAAADLVEQSGAGLTLPPSDPDALAAAIGKLDKMGAKQRAAMGERGRRYLLEHHSKERVFGQYERFFNEACA